MVKLVTFIFSLFIVSQSLFQVFPTNLLSYLPCSSISLLFRSPCSPSSHVYPPSYPSLISPPRSPPLPRERSANYAARCTIERAFASPLTPTRVSKRSKPPLPRFPRATAHVRLQWPLSPHSVFSERSHGVFRSNSSAMLTCSTPCPHGPHHNFAGYIEIL